MNAKDKEKLNIAKIIMGKTKADVIVIDPEELRKKADIKNKEFYEGVLDKAEEPETQELKTAQAADDELSAEEQLSCDIALQLVFMTEDRFEEMIDEMDLNTVKQLVRRIENSKSKTAIKMLQSMFLAHEMADVAESLDMLNVCADYDKDA